MENVGQAPQFAGKMANRPFSVQRYPVKQSGLTNEIAITWRDCICKIAWVHNPQGDQRSALRSTAGDAVVTSSEDSVRTHGVYQHSSMGCNEERCSEYSRFIAGENAHQGDLCLVSTLSCQRSIIAHEREIHAAEVGSNQRHVG